MGTLKLRNSYFSLLPFRILGILPRKAALFLCNTLIYLGAKKAGKFMRYLVDLCRLSFISKKQLEEIISGPKPSGVLVSCHYGAFELSACYIGHLTTVALPEPDSLSQKIRSRIRERFGVKSLNPFESTCLLKLTRLAKSGQTVALTIDRNYSANGIHTRFLGQDVILPSGPFFVAQKSGRPITPVLCRFSGNSYCINTLEPIHVSDNWGEASERLSRIFEREIAKDTSQWFNFTHAPESPC